MAGEKSCVTLLSGGMDSATLLALATHSFNKVFALTLIYAQRHDREVESAKRVAEFYGVPHKIMDISNINALLQGSALTSSEIDVPKGHYAEENMKLTVVPARNTILLSLAAGFAISLGYTHVSFGAHAGDHAIYPDCRPEFVDAMQNVFCKFHFWPIGIWAPFLDYTKGGIINAGKPLNVPYELTWTCYDPQPNGLACGKCGSCTERIEAFYENRLIDPVQYVGGWDVALKNALEVLEKGPSR